MSYCFNLVIESLLISSSASSTEEVSKILFQSRNRESSNFKFCHETQLPAMKLQPFQSRNRESSNFKLMPQSPLVWLQATVSIS